MERKVVKIMKKPKYEIGEIVWFIYNMCPVKTVVDAVFQQWNEDLGDIDIAYHVTCQGIKDTVWPEIIIFHLLAECEAEIQVKKDEIKEKAKQAKE